MIVIKKLVTENMTLHKNFLIIEIKEKSSSYFWIKKEGWETQLYYLSNKNKGQETLRQINTILLGKIVQLDNIYQDPTILLVT